MARGSLRTESGLSAGFTRLPSKRKRTELGAFPCRSQKASISFLRAVVRLILKKTSLLLSVTLILRCSLAPVEASGFSCAPGLPFSSDPDMAVKSVVVKEAVVVALLALVEK